jgi:hypothetical protein
MHTNSRANPLPIRGEHMESKFHKGFVRFEHTPMGLHNKAQGRSSASGWVARIKANLKGLDKREPMLPI